MASFLCLKRRRWHIALLDKLYIHVTSEKISHEIESTDHSVEKGENITDHIKNKPLTLSLSGKIVDFDNTKAYDVIKKIEKLQKGGYLVTYIGRNVINNVQIQTFTTDHPNTNSGGADFDIELKEVNIAKSSYTVKKLTKAAAKKASTVKTKTKAGTQQVSKGSSTKVYHITKKGDTVWLLVNKTYKSLGSTVDWVIQNNPNAFSKKGDATTLKVGVKLWIGNRK